MAKRQKDKKIVEYRDVRAVSHSCNLFIYKMVGWAGFYLGICDCDLIFTFKNLIYIYRYHELQLCKMLSLILFS